MLCVLKCSLTIFFVTFSVGRQWEGPGPGALQEPGGPHGCILHKMSEMKNTLYEGENNCWGFLLVISLTSCLIQTQGIAQLNWPEFQTLWDKIRRWTVRWSTCHNRLLRSSLSHGVFPVSFAYEHYVVQEINKNPSCKLKFCITKISQNNIFFFTKTRYRKKSE